MRKTRLAAPLPFSWTAFALALLILAVGCSSETGGGTDDVATNPPAADASLDSEADTATGDLPADDQPTAVPTTPTAVPPQPEVEVSADRPSIDSADDLCDVLINEGFETRSEAWERVGGRMGADAQQTCPEAVAAFELARNVRNSADAIAASSSPVELTNLRCSDGEYSFIATNLLDEPVGVHLALRILLDDDEDPYRSGTYPLVIWSLAANDSQGIEGQFDQPPSDDYRCNLSARFFSPAPDGDASVFASRSEGAAPEDDPTVWFVELLNREVTGFGSGMADSAADTEDLRSLAYDSVVASAVGASGPDRIPNFITVCNGSIDQPSDERMSFLYFISYPDDQGGPDDTYLRHGLFRRGLDGQWRWLSTPQYFNSEAFWGCGTPTD